ncbi:transcriptional repressor CTCF-like isoform X2 [Anthonomus grandis grandis]|nr:transcriptional repressor CTCF-like isoform X2 [Anthonomus grandis grandis]XP_050303065.1 transcriptional repressor CTCF-like isoform X2 [Anthonomus grandis grandis]
MCLQCVHQLIGNYIFKTRCIHNQDKILKLKNMLQRPIYLEEVIQGTDFHKENLQTSEVVYNSLKILLGKEFGNGKNSNQNDIKNDKMIQSTASSNGLSENGDNQVAESKLIDLGEVKINYSEVYAEELSPSSNERQEIFNSLKSFKKEVGYSEEPIKKAKKSPKSYKCEFCHKQFTQKIHSDGHLLNKHKDIPNIEAYISNRIHYCEYCEYRTINSYNLSCHKMTRHGKRQSAVKFVKCDICDYKTHNRGNFSIHMRRHDTARPFVCKLCKRTFAQKVNLDCHYLASHCDEQDVDLLISSKIYQCPSCDFKALDKSKYAKHVAGQHGGELVNS